MNTLPPELQPDQSSERWDDFVSAYEAVFEPFTLAFAKAAMTHLPLEAGQSVLDVGAGAGGAALALARRGCAVTAIDASPGMVERLKRRAEEAGLAAHAQVMDGQALDFPDASFDAALSIFGVILFPDAVKGMSEIRRVLKPGGRVAIAAWTQPENYELGAHLRAAMLSIWPDMPPMPLPPQLRFKEEPDFRALFADAGFAEARIETAVSLLKAPSAQWLADRIAFAPGMAAMMSTLGDKQPEVISAFVKRLEQTHGTGEIALPGMAFIGSASRA